MLKSIITDQISMDLEEALKTAKKYGFNSVELHGVWGKTIEDCSFDEVSEVKRLLNQYDMKVTNLATTIFFMCKLKEDYVIELFNPDFKTTNSVTLDEHLMSLEKACQIAERLDCPNIRIFPFRYPENHIEVGTTEDLDLIATNFKKAAKIAEKYNVTLVVENCPYSHCPKLEMTSTLVNMVNRPNLKLLYDPANSYRAVVERVPAMYLGKSMRDEISEFGDDIRHTHLKNYHFDASASKPFIHTSLTKGDLDYAAILTQLNHAGYHGAYSLEPEVPLADVYACMEDLTTILDKIQIRTQ